MTLDVIIPIRGGAHDDLWKECLDSWGTCVSLAGGNNGVLPAMQDGYENTTADILAFFHDDVICREPGWRERVLKEFEDEKVGVLGFGGALELGTDELYRKPYEITQLRRSFYASNVDDAETHGERFSGARDVAVLDGFSLIVRRTLLDRLGGYPVTKYPPHHVYDMWTCASAHRLGYRVRLVGIRCAHLGGRTACTREYQEWARTTKWGSDAEMHSKGHRLFYDEFRGLLPIRVARGTNETRPDHGDVGERPGSLSGVGRRGDSGGSHVEGLREPGEEAGDLLRPLES